MRSLVAVAIAVGALGASTEAWAEDLGTVQLGPDFGVIHRQAQPNRADIEYGPGIVYGAHAQILAASWMRFSLYYQHARQPLFMPQGSLGHGAIVHPESGHFSSYVLGARIQPTVNLSRRLHLWFSAGAGWGKVSAPAMEIGAVDSEVHTRSAPREGVLVELPFGVGGSFDIIPGWVALSIDATYAPLTNQSGDMYHDVQAIDASGNLTHIGSMPKLGPTMAAFASVLIEL